MNLLLVGYGLLHHTNAVLLPLFHAFLEHISKGLILLITVNMYFSGLGPLIESKLALRVGSTLRQK